MIGTPSTTSTVGGSAWYYITQKPTANTHFMDPSITDQHVLAIYFDKDKKVTRARQLWPEGRQNLRFRLPHDPDRRRRFERPERHVQNLLNFAI